MKKILLLLLLLPTRALAQGSVDAQPLYMWSSDTQRFKVSTGSGAPSGGSTSDMWVDYNTGEVYTKRNAGAGGNWTLLIRAEDTNTYTARQTFNAGITMSGLTNGDIIINGGSGNFGGLSDTATGRVLISTGVGSTPSFSATPTMNSVCDPTWISRTTAWCIDHGGNGEIVNSFYTNALHAKTFVADDTLVTDGQVLLTIGRAELSEDFLVPSLGTSSGNFRVKYKNGSTANVFSSGDTVVLRTSQRISGALIFGDAVGVVTSPSSSNPNYQEWTFTRNSGADGGSLPGSVTVPGLSTVVNYGAAGSGMIEMNALSQSQPLSNLTSSSTTATATTAVDHGLQTGDTVVISGAAQPNYNGSFSITRTSSTTFTYTMSGSTSTPATCSNQCVIAGAYGMNGPYIRFGSWATAPTLAHTTWHTYVGNVRPVTGTLEYGFLTGVYPTQYIRLTNSNADVHGVPFHFDNVTIDSSGITVADNSAASAPAATHGYQFTSGISGSIYGLYGSAFSSVRDLYMQNTTTNSTVTSRAYVAASSDTRTSQIFLLAAGSGTGGGLTTQIDLTADVVYAYPASGDGEIRVQNSAANKKLTLQPQFIGTTTAHDLSILANNSTRIKVYSGGGIGINGAADMGSGTINMPAGGGIYLNGTAYNFPSSNEIADLKARIAGLEETVTQLLNQLKGVK